MNKRKLTRNFIIGTFVTLYVIVSIISTIHVIDFFRLSNPEWLAVSLAIAFEIGAAASLAAIIALDKMSKWMVWSVFIILTGMQMMGNTYYTYSHVHDYQSWVELFGLIDEDPIFQKRILSIISGAILPIVALGFIKSLVDYIRPEEEEPSPASSRAAYENAFRENPPVENDEELETASLVDLQSFIDREEVIEPSDADLVTPEILEFLEKNGELTKEDIENYKKSTKNNGEDDRNPQVLPGVN